MFQQQSLAIWTLVKVERWLADPGRLRCLSTIFGAHRGFSAEVSETEERCKTCATVFRVKLREFGGLLGQGVYCNVVRAREQMPDKRGYGH